MSEDKKPVGALQASLDRNIKQVRADRARTIATEAKTRFRRNLEDLYFRIQKLKNEQDAMLDMSPDNALSVIKVDSFDSEKFADRTAATAIELHEKQEKFDILSVEFERLFGYKLEIAD